MSQTYQEGGRVTIGDRKFIVPKATLAVAKAVSAAQSKLARGGNVDGFQGAAEVLHHLLVKASPDLTAEELLDLVDVDGLKETVAQVQEAAGFKRCDPGGSVEPEEPGWDRLYGRIITVTGWRWEWVDEMLLEQVDALATYWEACPPVHEVAAAMVGYRPPPTAETRAGQARASALTDEERLMVERWDRAVGVA